MIENGDSRTIGRFVSLPRLQSKAARGGVGGVVTSRRDLDEIHENEAVTSPSSRPLVQRSRTKHK